MTQYAGKNNHNVRNMEFAQGCAQNRSQAFA